MKSNIAPAFTATGGSLTDGSSESISPKDLQTGVSVVICCYNSEQVLPETLKHLARQITPQSCKWEVVVVNNASTDRTADIAAEIWNEFKCPSPLRVVNETTPGLSAARRRGTLEANYSILIFCDDDNWLCDSYVSTAQQIMLDGKIASCGGMGKLATDIVPPNWFSKFHRSFAIGPQANESGPINSYPYGAGVVLRTAILRKAYGLGFKSLLSDRKGNTLSSGGDGEIAEWLAILDTGNWYYNSELQFFHFIETPRLNKTYLYRLSNGFGQMTPILRIYQRFRAQKPTVDPSKLYYQQLLRSFVMLFAIPIRLAFKGKFRYLLHRQFAELIWVMRNRETYVSAVGKIDQYWKASDIRS